jgi:hypothetical protein
MELHRLGRRLRLCALLSVISLMFPYPCSEQPKRSLETPFLCERCIPKYTVSPQTSHFELPRCICISAASSSARPVPLLSSHLSLKLGMRLNWSITTCPVLRKNSSCFQAPGPVPLSEETRLGWVLRISVAWQFCGSTWGAFLAILLGQHMKFEEKGQPI